MYRLLVVDDEPFIVNGLYEFLLHASGLELDVCKAYSGDEAVEWLRRTKIDIVITDIRMPEMSGLQLLEAIKRQWPHCRVIFLTGYDEFDYVYRAIQQEAVGYLLKTEGYEKIVELVEKSIREIEAELKADHLVAQAQRQLKLAAPMLQKELLLGLLRGERSSAAARREQFRQLDMPLAPDGPFALVLGRVGRSAATDGSLRAETLFRAKLFVEQHLPASLPAASFAMDDQTLVWLLQPKRQPDALDVPDAPNAPKAEAWTGAVRQIQGALELAQEACGQAMKLAVSFVVAGEPIAWERAAERFDAMRSWLGSLPDVGGSGVILQYAEEMEVPPFFSRTNEASAAAFALFKQFERLGHLLESGRREEGLELLGTMTSGMERLADEQPVAAAGLYHALALLLLSAVQAWGMYERLSGEIDLLPLMQPDRFSALPDKGAYCSRLAELIFERESGMQASRAVSAIHYIQHYIVEHLHEDLSLVHLAEVSHFNPSYLSRLFKQVTGENLNAFIQEARLKQAVEWLKDPSLKIHEVALRVGYENAPYFTKIFKKATGMNPQDYRDLYGNK